MNENIDLVWLRASDLKDNPKNWRRHPPTQEKAVKALMDGVGWAGVAVMNKTTGNLIDGHLRKKIADSEDIKIPVIVGEWTPEQEAMILSFLDPSAGMAITDLDTYMDLAQDFITDSKALLGLQEAVMNNEQRPMPNLTKGQPAGDIEPFTQPGQVWRLGNHVVLLGESAKPGDGDAIIRRWEEFTKRQAMEADTPDADTTIEQLRKPDVQKQS